MSELKPCPFCGSKLNPEYTISYDYIKKCYVLYHECTFLRCHIEIYGATQEECIAAWNRRTQPANEPKECPAMVRVEGGIPYCSDKQTACDGCKPANEPLTLEQLREMDGEPVCMICAGGCLRNYADPLPHCDGCTFRERR